MAGLAPWLRAPATSAGLSSVPIQRARMSPTGGEEDAGAVVPKGSTATATRLEEAWAFLSGFRVASC